MSLSDETESYSYSEDDSLAVPDDVKASNDVETAAAAAIAERAHAEKISEMHRRQFRYASICIFLMLLLSFGIAIGASIRFADPCSMGGDLHCSIPECQCGTPNRRPGCREQPRWKQDICYPKEFNAYQKSGGDVHTWRLCALSAAILAMVLVAFVFLRYKVMQTPIRHSPSEYFADSLRHDSARFITVSGCLYVAVVFLLGLSIFVGVVLARKKATDFVHLPSVAQAIIYIGIAWITVSLPLLVFVYKGRQ